MLFRSLRLVAIPPSRSTAANRANQATNQADNQAHKANNSPQRLPSILPELPITSGVRKDNGHCFLTTTLFTSSPLPHSFRDPACKSSQMKSNHLNIEHPIDALTNKRHAKVSLVHIVYSCHA